MKSKNTQNTGKKSEFLQEQAEQFEAAKQVALSADKIKAEKALNKMAAIVIEESKGAVLRPGFFSSKPIL